MRKTLIIARRELAGYFVSPMAYVVAAMLLMASSLWFFHRIFIPDQQATLRPLFEAMATIMIFVVPLLTMRQLAEEFHSGTVETLMTAPVTESQVVTGKFLGVMAFYVVLLATTLILLAVMQIFGQPDPGIAAVGYLGMLLLGAMYVAAGLWASSMTTYQLVAALGGVGICAAIALLPQGVVLYGAEPWNELAGRFSVMIYVKDFARGRFDTRGLVFFITTTGVLLHLSIKTLESKRWR
ncbi:MAG: ABC transporter permease [Planctomycetota bacterium]|jgi:ABC-2 type transport system permease protein